MSALGNLRAAALGSVISSALGLPAAAAPVETTLYSFHGTLDGGQPSGALVLGPAGVLYGSTSFGGKANKGVVFQLSPPPGGTGRWTEAPLYSFKGGADGDRPAGGLIGDSQGNLYGVTYLGGGSADNGTVFRLSPPPAGASAWSETILYRFRAIPDGTRPEARLTRDIHGALYGSTSNGGAANQGAVFRLTPPPPGGSTWTEAVLYSFLGGNDVISPSGRLWVSPSGAIYGAADSGGTRGLGGIYRLTPPAVGQTTWTETILYSFRGHGDGSLPFAGLTSDAGGGFYGSTTGDLDTPSNGTAFSLRPPAGAQAPWMEAPIFDFPLGGSAVYAELVRDPAGNLYGGSVDLSGTVADTVFELSPPTGGQTKWTLHTLAEFGGGLNGTGLFNALIRAPNGVLYGTTTIAGQGDCFGQGCGTVFQIVP